MYINNVTIIPIDIDDKNIIIICVLVNDDTLILGGIFTNICI